MLGGIVAACTRDRGGVAARSAAPSTAPSSAPSAGASAAPTLQPSGTAAPHAATGPALEVIHGARTGNLVALTFHGAGDPALARSILTDAHRRGAVVTVLAVGTWLRDNPEAVGLVRDNGHELGNHTFHHLPMRRLSAAQAYDEIARCRDELEAKAGSPGRWFRPSGTPRATGTILAAAGRAGYRTSVAYDVDPRDYQDPGAAQVRRRVAAAVQPGSVVSLHLGHSGTVQALPGILDDLAARGLKPVGLTRVVGA